MDTATSRIALPRYLDAYSVIRTTDPEAMRDALINRFGARSFELSDSSANFVGIGNHIQFEQIGLSYCSYDAHSRVRFPETNYARQLFSLAGRAVTRIGQQIVEVQAEQSCVLSGDADFTTDFGAGYEQLVLRVDKQVLLKKLSALIGSAPPKRIEFSPTIDFTSPQARNLRRLVLNFAHQMSSAEVPLPKPVLEEMQQTIAVAFLCCNQHNLSRLIERDEKACTPWQVRSVEDYIEANWAEAMSIEKLAAVTNTSARSIFSAFRKSRGYTPMAFAKSVRLKNAKAMLERGGAPLSVTDVAYECGFGNLGHFARDYREAFGELPSVTRSRRRMRP